ncbi:LADA_0G06821g1_1 [Lachancea dasiensis]|uniref:LADA_0G06821g1_1 n=1 Tax=Lachancea dasiensis TaxID=1072105 RepID=A0A1G4JTF0_9SACH|nr:LADA_0G06821g1_1 [Lachancea dasiensis]
MISDDQLNTLAIACGVVTFTLIVLYHAILSTTKTRVKST